MNISNIITLVIGLSGPILTPLIAYAFDKRSPRKMKIREEQILRVYAPLAGVLLREHPATDDDITKQAREMLNILNVENTFHLSPVILHIRLNSLLRPSENANNDLQIRYTKIKDWILNQYVRLKRKTGYPYLMDFEQEYPKKRSPGVALLILGYISVSIALVFSAINYLIDSENPLDVIIRIGKGSLFAFQPIFIFIAAGLLVAVVLYYAWRILIVAPKSIFAKKKSKNNDSNSGSKNHGKKRS